MFTSKDTMRAYWLILRYKDLCQPDLSLDQIETNLFEALDRSQSDIEYIMFHLVDFKTVKNLLNESHNENKSLN